MRQRVKILIVDDHPVFRRGLREIIEEQQAFEVVGEAADGAVGLHLAAELQPDIVVLDVDMPQINGLQMARALRKDGSAVQVVFLTMHGDEDLFNAALDLGVKGYVLKENAGSEIVSCLVSVAKGEAYVSPLLTGFLLRRRGRAEMLATHRPGLSDLTTAEKRILKRIAEKKTSREIALELNVSPRTVETHRTNICTKLSLKGSNSLLQFALENKEALSALA